MNRLQSIPLLGGSRTDLVAPISQETPAPNPEPSPTQVDWNLIVRLRRETSELIAQECSKQPGLTPDDKQQLGYAIAARVVREHATQLRDSGAELWPLSLEQQYVRTLRNAIYGYGRLQPVLEIPDVENIEIHGCDSVMLQYGDGRRVAHPPVADSDEELIDAVRFLGESADPPRPFDDAHPTMTLALGDRFRLHAIGFGLSYRPSVIIRQHILTEITLGGLCARGMLPPEVKSLLHKAVLARQSIVVSGDQGAGKTTLLRALIASIPDTERFGTLETDYELLTHLQSNRRNMLALQARVGLGEMQDGRRLGEFSVADLVPEALRQNLTRLIVGEVRGEEAGAMFTAMQAGTGTLSTTHSHSAAATIDRLASRVAQGRVLTISEAYRQIAQNISLLVHVQLVDDTWRHGARRRYISEIRHLTGAIEGDRPISHLVYRANRDGNTELFQPDAELLSELAPFEEGL
ncbi:MAG: secretion protein [Propionibacteriales bacterium]|nr:MAG: secretion protein [Propionibacteriales bacterium]